MNRTALAFGIAFALLAGCNSGKSSNAGTASGTAAPAAGATASGSPNCNGRSPVWALEGPKVYLLPGDRMYGKTRRGSYMCLSDATAEGYRHARGRRHHHHAEQQVF
jgi:hypothetical protein